MNRSSQEMHLFLDEGSSLFTFFGFFSLTTTLTTEMLEENIKGSSFFPFYYLEQSTQRAAQIIEKENTNRVQVDTWPKRYF